MSKPIRRVCLKCQTLFRGRLGTPCPNCKTTGGEPFLGKKLAEPEDDEPDPVSTIPVAPPLPPQMAENTPDFGGGGITPEMLRAGRNALKAAPIKPAKPLPGLAPGASAIPLGVRVLANSIQTAVVYNVRFRRECPRFSGLFSLPPTSFDLQKYLNAIASGKENLNHANFNTTYRNRGGELPLKSNPLKQQGIRYFEYGWSEIIPQSVWAQWYAPPSYLKLAPAEVTGRLSGFLKLDGGALNTPRLIFSESGEVFFTPDHYHVFFRYSEVLMTWTPYLSPVFRGQSSDWDASIYQPGTKETGFR